LCWHTLAINLLSNDGLQPIQIKERFDRLAIINRKKIINRVCPFIFFKENEEDRRCNDDLMADASGREKVHQPVIILLSSFIS